jgi:predicted nucleic acid-binding Zn ribbon protein
MDGNNTSLNQQLIAVRIDSRNILHEWRRIPGQSGCPVLAYQMQLNTLCDQAVREKDQMKPRKLMDQILQPLAENQKDAGEVSTPHFVVPIYEENKVQ